LDPSWLYQSSSEDFIGLLWLDPFPFGWKPTAGRADDEMESRLYAGNLAGDGAILKRMRQEFSWSYA